MDIDIFRNSYPAFTDANKYPDRQVEFYITVGQKLLRAERWEDLREEGIGLFVAHNLVLVAQDLESADTGDVPGATPGAVSSMSVDKVSVSYDNASSADEKAGHWNLTTYGKQFIRLARMLGAGGIQL